MNAKLIIALANGAVLALSALAKHEIKRRQKEAIKQSFDSIFTSITNFDVNTNVYPKPAPNSRETEETFKTIIENY